MQTPQPKPGIKTSEFYVTLASNLVGILVLLGYLSPQAADEFQQAIVSVIGGLVVIFTTVTYLYGRIVLKQQAVENSSNHSEVLDTSGSDSPQVNSSSEVISYPL